MFATHKSCYTQALYHIESLCAEKPFHTGACTQMVLHRLYRQDLLHLCAFTQTNLLRTHALYTQAGAFKRRSFYTQMFLHTLYEQKFFHVFFVQKKLLHAEDFTRRCITHGWSFKRFTHKWITPTHLYTLTHRCVCTHFLHQSFNTQAFLHLENFYAQKPLHTGALAQKRFYTHFAHKRFCSGRLLHTEAFTNRRFYTECTRKSFYTPAFWQSESFHTQKLLQTDAVTRRKFLGAKAFARKEPWWNHPSPICNHWVAQRHRTTHAQQGTFMLPRQCDLQTLLLQNQTSASKPKMYDLETSSRKILQGKWFSK